MMMKSLFFAILVVAIFLLMIKAYGLMVLTLFGSPAGLPGFHYFIGFIAAFATLVVADGLKSKWI